MAEKKKRELFIGAGEVVEIEKEEDDKPCIPEQESQVAQHTTNNPQPPPSAGEDI